MVNCARVWRGPVVPGSADGEMEVWEVRKERLD